MLAIAVPAAGVIPTVPVGPAGLPMPLVSLGTGSGQHGDVANATATWLQAGGSGIDTAYIYNDEASIAAGVKAVGASWSSIFLTTKIPCTTTQAAKADVASNLRSLGVGRVDLLLIHSPRPWRGGTSRCSVAETWAVLEEAQTVDLKLRAFIAKKMVEYLGEDEPTLVEHILAKLRAQTSAADIEEHLAKVLDDDAAVFVVKLWRMLVFEMYAAQELKQPR